MVNNVIAVYINGINLTRYVVMPLKWANLLDEQLDEAVISLRNCPKKVIAPLTPVEIRITNNVYMGGSSVYSKSITKYMIVADQPDSNENPVGSGRYDHDISIIEVTKLLERIVVDSITYTNVKSKIYTANQSPMPLTVSYENGASESDYTNYYKGQPASLITPIPTNETLRLPSWNSQWTLPTMSGSNAEWTNVTVQVLDTNGQVITSANGATATPSISIAVFGNYTIVYKGKFSYQGATTVITRQFPTLTFTFAVAENRLPLKKLTITDVINRLLDVAEPIRQGEQPHFSFNAQQAALFDNILAPQFSFTKQTLRECLQAIGGVVHGEPRLDIKNDGGGWYYEISYDIYGGTQYSNIETRPYIKETVKQVIEQYCTHIDTSAENLVNAIGESTGAFLSGRNGVITEPYDGGFKTVRCDTMYARIDESNMQIVTQLPIYAIQKLECGIIPNNEGAGSGLGAATTTIEVPEGATTASGTATYTGSGTVKSVISILAVRLLPPDIATATVTSIDDNVISFELTNVSAGSYIVEIMLSLKDLTDITPYVFEASEYNSRLSSYDSAYPYSKAYGLMYTQGQKNITALNFKQDNPINPVFENYAIINILEGATGQSLTALGEDYPLLAFRVTYTPFYSARVAQTKPNISDFPRGSALIYNQSANVIESRFYGENLKGVIARLGNVEKTKTYTLSRLGLVPQAGQKYDDDYYISAVSVELFTNLIKVTLALSKDFNRLSQYIGISSVKRFSEVSQTQAQERNVLYRDYIVIGDSMAADSDSHIGDNLMQAVIDTFTAELNSQPLTNVVAWGMTAQNNPLPNVVQLPVIGSAFGNSISFEWAYEDNFSAGAVAQHATGGTGSSVSGYFQNNLQYTDYYGRVYYYNFDLMPSGTIPTTFEEQTDIGTSLPKYDKTTPTTSSGYFSTIGLQPEMLRKDNREIIKVNAQVDFVTNRKGMIIGSALAFNNPAVGGMEIQAAKLYVFTDKLDKFINHVSGSIDVPFTTEATQPYVVQTIDLPSAALDISELADGQFNISVQGGVFPGTNGTQYQSWAIVTAQLVSTEQVEDEGGNQSSQTVQYGGDVLIAQNMDFSAGDSFPPVYFTKKREVFDKSVWTTAR